MLLPLVLATGTTRITVGIAMDMVNLGREDAATAYKRVHEIAKRLNSLTTQWHPDLTLPNSLTCSRFVVGPLLVYVAWSGYASLYVGLLFLSFLTDLADGACARLLKLRSELGSQLDTLADFLIYIIIPITAWWLWPDLVRAEAVNIGLVLFGCTIPAILGALKFRAIVSYHTWSSKLAAAAVGTSVMLMFLGGPAWLFHYAAPLSAIAALEQIGITLTLTEHRSDVRSWWHVLHEHQ